MASIIKFHFGSLLVLFDDFYTMINHRGVSWSKAEIYRLVLAIRKFPKFTENVQSLTDHLKTKTYFEVNQFVQDLSQLYPNGIPKDSRYFNRKNEVDEILIKEEDGEEDLKESREEQSDAYTESDFGSEYEQDNENPGNSSDINAPKESSPASVVGQKRKLSDIDEVKTANEKYRVMFERKRRGDWLNRNALRNLARRFF
jgi:hypothetical protein